MLLNGLQDVINIIRFSAFLGVSTIILASFIPIHLYVSYTQTAEIDKNTQNMRAGIIIAWIILTWSFLLFNAQIVDMFHKELELTNLICAYSQLKPSYSSNIHKLTKNIMKTLEGREKRAAIYGIMFYNTGLILRLVASTAYAIARPADAPAAAATTASTTQAPGSVVATGATEASKAAGIGNSMMTAGSGMASSGEKGMSSLGSAMESSNPMSAGSSMVGEMNKAAHDFFKLLSGFRLK
ncbi:hypothetical protein K1T71_005134 [Dendrolimus kikuchii]|uniref:Uncharacterized protein n=1 Tax=Dendrolimus kikuchii TaxID=765133 RepID=A0ACC1D7N5_9NEOP|nr:hypothetical protein K1T71_005134 [Dendrolimus kikuchii]